MPDLNQFSSKEQLRRFMVSDPVANEKLTVTMTKSEWAEILAAMTTFARQIEDERVSRVYEILSEKLGKKN